MNTFVPYPDISASVASLDWMRLGKQRVEAFQCLCALQDPWALRERYRRTGKSEPYKGWVNHPAVKMWRGHTIVLKHYYNATIQEWVERGYNNTMMYAPIPVGEVSMPSWWGDDRVHASHRGRLMDKDPEWYSRFWDDVPISVNEGYFWPVD